MKLWTLTLMTLSSVTACRPQAKPATIDDPVPAQAPEAMPPPSPADLVGVVTTQRTAVVAAEFEGRVRKILVISGQRVRSGDPLVHLDDSQLRQRVEAARHNEEAARAKMLSQKAASANARRRLDIERDLLERGAQSREAVTTARFEVSSSDAAATAARAEYQAASSARVELEQQLAKATLLAPMDGVVSAITVKEGEIVATGRKIARVFDPRQLRVQFELPRQRRDGLAVGHLVEAIGDGVTLRARVSKISADLAPPLQFAIATADVEGSGPGGDPSAATRVGTEVRVRPISSP